MIISIHPLQIATLSIWLSVVAAGTVGLLWRHGHMAVPDSGQREITVALSDIVLGSESPAAAADGDTTTSNDSPAEEIAMTEDFPVPPEMPAVADAGPLPEVPELPVRQAVSPATKSRAATPAAPRGPRASATSSGTRRNRGNGGAGMSESARLAAGSMPAPSYPPEARRKGQTGTVVVEFTVDATGRVIYAHAKSPSPWPLLNNEAVRTVRSWKFPPGGVMKLQRPIVFQLR